MSRALIYKATKDDQKAIGGPILREISEKSKVSLQECSAIEGYLLKRLEKNSPDIKLKVLNIIKYLCVNGRDDFRISFQRNNTLIRECTHFRGPPDPLRGDAPSEKVRQAAKDTMTAIFNGGSRNNSRTHGKITGFGSDTTQDYSSSYSSNNYSSNNYDTSRQTSTPIHDYGTGTFSVPKIESGAYSTGRMVGYGSGGTYDPKKEQSFMDRMRSKQTKKSQPTYPFKPHVSAGPYSGPSGGHDPDPVMTSGRRRKKGEVGGSWGVPNKSSGGGTFGSGSSQQHSYGQSSKPIQSQTYQARSTFNSGSRSAPRETKSSPTDGAFERGLIDQMTQASGVYRSGAFKKETQDFIKKCLSLDIDVIAQLLDEKLASPAYITQLKAVGIIQALFDRNISDFDAAEEYFKDMPQNLLEVKKSGKTKALKDKAGKILDRLGISAEENPSEPTPAPVQTTNTVKKVQNSSPQLNILNFGGDSTSAPDTTPLANPTSGSTSVGEFNFMDPQPTSTSEEPTGNLFGDLTIKDPEPALFQDVTVVSTEPEPKQEPSDPMLKFFNDSKEPEKKNQQTSSGSGNLLDDLMGTSTTKNQGSIFPNSSQQQQQPIFGQQQPLFGQQQPLFGQQTMQQQPIQQQPFFGQQQSMQQRPMQQQTMFGQQQTMFGQQQQTMFGQQQQTMFGQQQPQQQTMFGQQQPMQSRMGYGMQQQQFFTQQQQPVYGQSVQQTSQSSGFGFMDPLDTSTIQTTSSSTKKKDAFAGMVDFTKS